MRLHTREESGLFLDRDGRWFHDGERVVNEKIAQAFSRGLARSPEGRYVIRFGQDWCFVTVEDAPLQVLAALPEPNESSVALKLSNGATEPLDPSTLQLRQGVLYCVASGDLPARFSRSAQAAVSALIVEQEGQFALRLGERAFPIRQ